MTSEIKIQNLKNTVSQCDRKMAASEENKDFSNWILLADIRLDALKKIAKLEKLNK